MSSPSLWLHDHDGLVTLLQIGVFGLLLASSGPRLLQAFGELELRLRWLFAAAALAALACNMHCTFTMVCATKALPGSKPWFSASDATSRTVAVIGLRRIRRALGFS